MTANDRWRPLHPSESLGEDEIDLELRSHIEGRIAEYRAIGMSDAEATRRARAEFGDIDLVARQCRTVQSPQPDTTATKRELMSSIASDIRLSMRALIRRPGFSLTVLATLVLAIGATTAVFSVVNGVLLQPLPHPDPDELVAVWEIDARSGTYEDHNVVAVANYGDWKRLSRSFESMAAFQIFETTYRGDTDPERVSSGSATADFFDILRATPRLGRTFSPEDDVPGAPPVVLVSAHFWQTRLGGDPAAIGRSIHVGSRSYEVIGVLAEGFRFLDRDLALWFPRRLTDSQFENRRSHTLRVLARLRPGVARQDAQSEMDQIVARLAVQHPEYLQGWGVNVVSLSDEVVGDTRPALLILLAAVGFVLLIAVVNVANLMLARTTAEHRELAIRTALGAARGRLMRLKLTESLILSWTGGVLGVVVAAVTTGLLLALAPSNLPHVSQVTVDGRVLAFAFGVSTLAGVLFGLMPALHVRETDLAGAMNEGRRGTTGSRGQRRIRSGFTVAQLGFSLVLLISAGLMLTTFRQLMRVDPGFDSQDVMTMQVEIPRATYDSVPKQVAFFGRALEEVASLPGVVSAGVTKFLPFAGAEWTWSLLPEGASPPPDGEKLDYGYHLVSPEYFATMGMTVVRGRGLTDRDNAAGVPVIAVNEAFARRFFGDEDPVGRRMRFMNNDSLYLEIVGVVGDVNHYSLDMEPVPAFYAPYSQVANSFMTDQMALAVRTAGDPASIVASVRAAVRGLDSEVVVSDVSPMADRVTDSVARSRFAMVLLAAFAAVALTMAVVGIYGVIAYTVGQRTQEIGVRIALGAEPRRIVKEVISTGARLALAGIGVGVVAAAIFTRFQSSMLYGVGALDARVYLSVSGLLAVTALLATYVPARRASRVDPMTVLRDE